MATGTPPRTWIKFSAALAFLGFAAWAGGSASAGEGRAATPGNTGQAGVFNPETFTLDNGMRVVVVSNHRVPVVSQMVWYMVGAADEPPGKSGIAHFLEHLMFKGTKTLPAGEFSRRVARNGGRENAFTSSDYTGYFQTVAKDRLEMVMEMEADRMSNLVLKAEEVETERQVIFEERRARTDNNPAAILREHVNATLFLNHPYGRPIIGWEHEVRDLSLDDLAAFYRRWYAPNNAILTVAGDITAAELRPLAEKYYGKIPPRPLPSRLRPQEPPQKAARSVVLKDARVRQPTWSRTYLAPSHITGETRHAYPLEVLVEILGQGATSRLYRSMVVERKLAVSAGAYYDADGLGPSTLVVYASPTPGVDVETLAAAVDGEIEVLLRDGVSEDEVARAKRRMRASTVYARDSLRTGVRVLGAALATGRTVEDVESWPARIDAVTVSQIAAGALAVFDESRSVTALLLPDKDA
jgi:zinc protease